ncbi:MAG: sulfotransferase [Paracoccus sp. (in: a-proteobacteria)]|uniref:sulfotransferase family protein n=1 Tax=Paracoccus sp. TaxID=267 RepID=UPI0026E0FA8C|nr:sulfotransferase family protein [Paracoccus sp. (in: a-proteobacteria)]MDO5631382.1 sulfotransferase [Paracoccus sp. (in: a-proteobacteria)]
MSSISAKIYKRLAYKLLNRMPYERPFVFGIGLSKTATTTLADALTILGYNVQDNPPITKVRDGRIIMDWPWWLRDCNAMTDLPVAAVMPEMVRKFPNAHFIYTTRKMEAWLKSCKSHFSPELHAARVQQGNEWMLELSTAIYGEAIFTDPESFRQAYLRHDQMVREIVPAERLLTIDLTTNPGWTPLCAFLGKPVPVQPFPHANVGIYKTQAATLEPAAAPEKETLPSS